MTTPSLPLPHPVSYMLKSIDVCYNRHIDFYRLSPDDNTRNQSSFLMMIEKGTCRRVFLF